MMYDNNKKGIVKLLVFGVIMIMLSAGLGTMLMAQNTIDQIVGDYYNSSVSAETKARIEAHTNPINFRDWNGEINIVILVMIITFFSYAIGSSYLNEINNFKGVFNFFLLIVLLAVTSYLGDVHTYIWTMPLFSGIEIEYSAISFYFTYMGRINLIIGVLICVLTVAPKSRKEEINVARLG